MLRLVNYRIEEQSVSTFNCTFGWCRQGNTRFCNAFDVLPSNLSLNTRKLLCFYKNYVIRVVLWVTLIEGLRSRVYYFSFSDHTGYIEPAMIKYALSCRLSANGIQFIKGLCNFLSLFLLMLQESPCHQLNFFHYPVFFLVRYTSYLVSCQCQAFFSFLLILNSSFFTGWLMAS